LTGRKETVDPVEEREMKEFLDAVVETKPMQYCHDYLAAKVGAKVPRLHPPN
jgi:hypothetical protein